MRYRSAVAFLFVLISASVASAVPLSFTGTLGIDGTVFGCPCADDGEAAQWAASVHSFVVPAPAWVSAITFSNGGGTNGAGQAIAPGGFQPYLSLFDGADVFLASTLVGITDPGGNGSWDVALAPMYLGPGIYQVAISAWMNMSSAENYGSGTLADGFTGLGNLAPGEDLHYAFDVLVEPEAAPVPEPATGALLLLGLAAGAHRRARRGPPRPRVS
jgi:hypothetical protein